MKYDKLTYNWWRWPNILVPSGLACIGIVILYYILLADPTTTLDNIKASDLRWFIIFIGVLFTGFGFCAAITNYFGGDTYSLKSKIFFKDLDMLHDYGRGIVVAFGDKAIRIEYNYKEILEHGYVETMTKYDHKQNIKDWSFIY